MGTGKKDDGKEKQVDGLKKKTITVNLKSIEGSTLICNRFSEAKREQIAAKQNKKPTGTQARGARDPEAEYKASLYTDNGTLCFPGSGLKKACVQAASFTDGITKVKARGALFIIGDMLPIQGSKPRMRTDTVRLQGGTTSLAYRGEFENWKMQVPVLFNENIISEEQVRNLFALAGFHVGIGDWRPEKNGSHGMFELS